MPETVKDLRRELIAAHLDYKRHMQPHRAAVFAATAARKAGEEPGITQAQADAYTGLTMAAAYASALAAVLAKAEQLDPGIARQLAALAGGILGNGGHAEICADMWPQEAAGEGPCCTGCGPGCACGSSPHENPAALVMPDGEFTAVRAVAEAAARPPGGPVAASAVPGSVDAGQDPPAAHGKAQRRPGVSPAGRPAAAGSGGPGEHVACDTEITRLRDRAVAAEAKLDEIGDAIKMFFAVHGNSNAASLVKARDLAEGIRQIRNRAPLP